MSDKKQKSYALEVTIVFFVIAAAFVAQGLINSANPPNIDNSNSGKKTALLTESDKEDEDSKDETQKETMSKKYNIHLTDLADAPDWKELDGYQYTIAKKDFERELEEIYTLNGSWRDWITTTDQSAQIRMSAADDTSFYELFFATEEKKLKPPKFWRNRNEIEFKNAEKPLLGLRIVIDPGHIGGKYSEIEERNFIYKDTPPIKEGNLTLTVSKMLATQLEILGAKVTLTREYLRPVNIKKPEEYTEYATDKLTQTGQWVTPEAVKRESEQLFYRAGEIRQRAEYVNHDYQPDLVLCLHFNANVHSEELYKDEHFHMILNGAYMAEEVALDDQRFTMMQRILQRMHKEEVQLSAHAAEAFNSHTGLEAYQYEEASMRALNVDQNPYLWARNLAANRSFLCPVIYYEPYLMNGADSHARINQGDFEGMRYLNEKLRPSIFREYVNAVTEGLVNYYSNKK